jgi:hypothetical protein
MVSRLWLVPLIPLGLLGVVMLIAMAQYTSGMAQDRERGIGDAAFALQLSLVHLPYSEGIGLLYSDPCGSLVYAQMSLLRQTTVQAVLNLRWNLDYLATTEAERSEIRTQLRQAAFWTSPPPNAALATAFVDGVYPTVLRKARLFGRLRHAAPEA